MGIGIRHPNSPSVRRLLGWNLDDIRSEDIDAEEEEVEELEQEYRDKVDPRGYPIQSAEIYYSNLNRGRRISVEIYELLLLQKTLKDAFYHRQLDGGPVAALTHPLYLEAQAKIEELQEELVHII